MDECPGIGPPHYLSLFNIMSLRILIILVGCGLAQSSARLPKVASQEEASRAGP